MEDLWVGGISDTNYQEKTGIFERQQKFGEWDLVDGKVLPFTNIFDRGYRCNLMAWRAGRQEVHQPTFARSDRRFTGMEMLIAASIAANRSKNERGVNRAKMSGVISRGLHPRGCSVRFNNVWLAWSFQANFMFKAVL